MRGRFRTARAPATSGRLRHSRPFGRRDVLNNGTTPDSGTHPIPESGSKADILSPGSVASLRNASTAQCVSGDATSVHPSHGTRGGVGGTGYAQWRVGTSTSSGQTLKNTDTGHCLVIASPPYGGAEQVMVTTCDSGQAQQLWGDGGTRRRLTAPGVAATAAKPTAVHPNAPAPHPPHPCIPEHRAPNPRAHPLGPAFPGPLAPFSAVLERVESRVARRAIGAADAKRSAAE